MPGPSQPTDPSPTPGWMTIRCGLAVTSAHTPPADARRDTACHWLDASHTHSGRPTMPSAPRGGAGRTSGSGSPNAFCARAANCAGVTVGALIWRRAAVQTTGTPWIACALAASCPARPRAEVAAIASAHTRGFFGPEDPVDSDVVTELRHGFVPAKALYRFWMTATPR